MKGLKIIGLTLLIAVLAVFATSGCRTCCSPSIEVGLCDPGTTSKSCNNFQIWTWNPVTQYPLNPNQNVTGSQLEALRPYLFKTLVKNYSKVDVRGVTVVFYWAAFGLFDRGTPIGAVAVDLKANESQWVSSPWGFTLKDVGDKHLCLTVRVFHPCDKNLENNSCWRNFQIIKIPWPLRLYAVPFSVDFKDYDGELQLEIEAPQGIEAYVAEQVYVKGAVEKMAAARKMGRLMVKSNAATQQSLLIRNVSSQYKSGDSFEITVRALKNKKEISTFTLQVVLE